VEDVGILNWCIAGARVWRKIRIKSASIMQGGNGGISGTILTSCGIYRREFHRLTRIHIAPKADVFAGNMRNGQSGRD